MTDTTAHFEPSAAEIAQDHAAAFAEDANRSARFQPVGDGYDEPFIEVAGVKAFLEVDKQGRYCVGVWDDSNGEHFTGPDGQPTIVVEVDGQQVWTSRREPQPPAGAPTHPVDALSEEARLDLLRRIFNVLEHGNPLGQGPAGVEHDSDTTNALCQVFADAGITFAEADA